MENKRYVPELSPNDKISRLPDELMLVLLSLLPRPEAAAMWCLSHTWRQLCNSVFLSFFCDEFNHPGAKQPVENTLFSRKGKLLEVFKVIWLEIGTHERLDYAVCNKAKAIHVIYRGANQVDIGKSVFTSHSLEELAILSYLRLEFPPVEMSLGSLKRLILQAMPIGQFINKVFEGCPMLEELHFVMCRLEIMELRLGKLKNLTIERCRVGYGKQNEVFIIKTPNLEHLHYNAVWQGYLCKRQHRAMYVAEVGTKLILEFPKLRTLTIGGLWLTHNLHAVSYFLMHTELLEQVTFLCNSPMIVKHPAELCGFVEYEFHCPNLDKVEIICRRRDWRSAPLLMAMFSSHGVPRNSIRTRIATTKECFSAGMPMLQTLQRIWNWIEADSKKKYQ